VAEKMLTNWFTFLLYKFLKVSLGREGNPARAEGWFLPRWDGQHGAQSLG